MMNIRAIPELGLCSGCGACTIICQNNAIYLKESVELNFPIVEKTSCIGCKKCLEICPGYDKYNRIIRNRSLDEYHISQKTYKSKYVIAYAMDNELRKQSASGGYITALLEVLIDKGIIDGAITLKQDLNNPLEYKSQIIRDIKSVKQTRGSRYYPASACVGLKELAHINGKFAFIGKPCEVQASRYLIRNSAKYKDKLPILISLFCHHTPTREGTFDILERFGIELEQIASIRYRGNGWPGMFQVIGKDKRILLMKQYREIWDKYLSRSMPLVCKLCSDPFGKYSDISVGDAWGFKDDSELGLSAVILRTSYGLGVHNISIQNKKISSVDSNEYDILRGQKPLLEKINGIDIIRDAYLLNYCANLDKIRKCIYIAQNEPRKLVKVLMASRALKKLLKTHKR